MPSNRADDGGSGYVVIAPPVPGRGGYANWGLHPNAQPNRNTFGLTPVHGRYSPGRIVPIQDSGTLNRGHNYAFNFHYNPQSIQIGTSLDPGLVFDPQDKSQLFYAAQQQITFSLMLNRIDDIYSPAASVPAYDGAHIQQYGTLYDLNYLWNVINGDGLDIGKDPLTGADLGTQADYGFLQMTALMVYFSPTFRLPCYVSSLSVTHVMFTVNMVPRLTEVDLTCVRIATSDPSDALNPNDYNTYASQSSPNDGTTP